MTKVTVNTQKQKMIPIKDATLGVWYVVSSYQFNQDLRGTVGVLIQGFNEADDVYENQLVSISGGVMNAKQLMLEEIKTLEISYTTE